MEPPERVKEQHTKNRKARSRKSNKEGGKILSWSKLEFSPYHINITLTLILAIYSNVLRGIMIMSHEIIFKVPKILQHSHSGNIAKKIIESGRYFD